MIFIPHEIAFHGYGMRDRGVLHSLTLDSHRTTSALILYRLSSFHYLYVCLREREKNPSHSLCYINIYLLTQKKNPELAIKAKNKSPNFVFLNTIMKWVITYLMAVYLIMYWTSLLLDINYILDTNEMNKQKNH